MKLRWIIEKCFKIEERDEILAFRAEKTLDIFEEIMEKSVKDATDFLPEWFDNMDDDDIRGLV
jgi:hypothetical protein